MMRRGRRLAISPEYSAWDHDRNPYPISVIAEQKCCRYGTYMICVPDLWASTIWSCDSKATLLDACDALDERDSKDITVPNAVGCEDSVPLGAAVTRGLIGSKKNPFSLDYPRFSWEGARSSTQPEIVSAQPPSCFPLFASCA